MNDVINCPVWECPNASDTTTSFLKTPETQRGRSFESWTAS